MTIHNKTKQTTIVKEVIEAKSLKDKSLGLLKHKAPSAMLIKTRFGIHTFFMKYAIDVLILDNTNHVVALKKTMKPNTFFLWHPKYNTVIELPEGNIQRSKTNIGDTIVYL